MPRSPVIQQSAFPYFVTARCINKEWFSIPKDKVWEIMCNQLYFTRHAFELEIWGFVLMDNHFHSIVSTPLANISQALAWFMRETSRDLTRAGNRINQTYGGRNYKTIIQSDYGLKNAYKYLYHNPIKAGICSNVLDYKYSRCQACWESLR